MASNFMWKIEEKVERVDKYGVTRIYGITEDGKEIWLNIYEVLQAYKEMGINYGKKML